MTNRVRFSLSIAVATCILVVTASFGVAQQQIARGGGGGGGNGDASRKSAPQLTTNPPAVSSAGVLSQLEEAKRRVTSLRAETAALRKAVAGDVADIRRLKGDPESQQAAFNSMIAAIASAKSDIAADLDAIVQIGQSLSATSGR